MALPPLTSLLPSPPPPKQIRGGEPLTGAPLGSDPATLQLQITGPFRLTNDESDEEESSDEDEEEGSSDAAKGSDEASGEESEEDDKAACSKPVVWKGVKETQRLNWENHDGHIPLYEIICISPYNLPPGPTPLPLIGNLHLLDLRRLDLSLMKLSEKYGPIFTIHLGMKKAVVLTGAKTIKEALVEGADKFSDRAFIPIFHSIQRGNGQFVSPIKQNVLTYFYGCYQLCNEESTVHTLPFNGSQYKINMFLEDSGEEWTNKDSLFHDDNMLATLLDLVMAGTETTSTTLQWGILLMMKYPEIQKKVQREIDSVLESGRLPRFADRHAMSYTHAVIHEFQRFSNVIPHLPHATSIDTELKGYHIPKGTTVIPLLTSILYDETQWETPNQFNPNHFLDSDGRFLKSDALYAFSIGRRVCAGESLARMELFLFITGLLQKFTFTPPPGVSTDDLDITPEVVFTIRPKSYKVCATPRQ
ncbi:cytochrome P450 2W1-like [Eleutherodactylus coqui]|uniref:cytochrome P450 2W1-like n=1 Tax=Eleutherodactylus coqui TaxID=57060 RepID=UPI00346250C5